MIVDEVLLDRHRVAAAADGLLNQLAIRLAGAGARRSRTGGGVGGHLGRRNCRFWPRVGGHLLGNCRFCCRLRSAGPRPRTGIPAALRYPLTVSRRTPVACRIRSSVHPSRPSAQNLLLFVSSKTLLIPAKDYTSTAPSTSRPRQLIAGFEVSINCRFWVSTEACNVFVQSDA